MNYDDLRALIVGGILEPEYFEDAVDQAMFDIKRYVLENLDDNLDEMKNMIISKQKDYGPRNILNSPFGALKGLVTREFDKVARAANLLENDREPKNESLEDTFMDMANYPIIALMVLRNTFERPLKDAS